MKSKTKKILAGLGLGVIGASVLTGCSMTDEQQKLLNDLSGKANEFVSIVEEQKNTMDSITSELENLNGVVDQYVENQNTAFTKQEVYNKFTLATKAFDMGLVKQFYAEGTMISYQGYFNQEYYSAVETLKVLNQDNILYSGRMQVDGAGEQIINVVADYENEIYHRVQNGYAKDISLNESFGYVYNWSKNLAGKSFDIDNIIDVNVLEDGTITFTISLDNVHGSASDYKDTLISKITMKDDMIQHIESWTVIENGVGSDKRIVSDYAKLDIKYSDIDFGEFEELHEELLNAQESQE